MSFLLRLPISRGYVKFSGCIMKRFTIIFNNSKMFKIPLSPKCRMKSVKPWCRVLSNQDTSPIYSRNSPYHPGCWDESWLNGEPSWRKNPPIHPRSLTWPLKMVVERLLSYWEDNVSGAMLNFRVVDFWLGHVGRMLVLKVLPRKTKKCPLKKVLKKTILSFWNGPLALEVAIILTQRIWEWGKAPSNWDDERFLGGENTQKPSPYGIPSPKTKSSHLKIGHPKRNSSPNHPFSGAMLVSGRVTRDGTIRHMATSAARKWGHGVLKMLDWQICRLSMKCCSLQQAQLLEYLHIANFWWKKKTPRHLSYPTPILLVYVCILKTRNRNQAWPLHIFPIWRISKNPNCS